MRLSSVEVIPYALPFREPYVTARGRLEQREMVLLRLCDDDGLVGLGEAVPLSLRGGASLEIVARELEALAEVAKLDPLGFAASVGAAALSAPARCALETALWDLGERRGESPHAFSRPEGDKGHDVGFIRTAAGAEAVVCNATLVAGAPADVATAAERWAGEGFRTFKLKLGADDDVGQVRAVREALGPEARIRIDANAAWDLATARRILRELEPFDVELAEQPVSTLAEMAELATATSIPLAGDESVASRAEAADAVAAGACAFTGIKLSKVGGAEEALAIAGVLPAYVSSALDGPVGIAAAARVAQELDGAPDGPDLAHGLATQRLFASTIAAVECELRGGLLHLPPGPGLGVEIDRAALEAHRL